MKIRFYKEEDNRWYADLPRYIALGGCKEDCEMVLGADIMLDILAQGDNEISLYVSTEENSHFRASLAFLNTEETGATYMAELQYNIFPVWLCDVTLYVFGHFPTKIYLK